jgi:3-methyl-2-oxobutanoate hydroxymethyltransferase
MLGMYSDMTPKFARRFANIGEAMKEAFADYKAAVQDASFPAPEHTFSAPEGTFANVH